MTVIKNMIKHGQLNGFVAGVFLVLTTNSIAADNAFIAAMNAVFFTINLAFAVVLGLREDLA